MKAKELLEYRENKGSSVDIAFDPIHNSARILVNINYRNIEGKLSDKEMFDPDSMGFQKWMLSDIGADDEIAPITEKIKAYNDSVELEALELVEAFKSMINAMIQEANHEVTADWSAVWNKYKDHPEVIAKMEKYKR